MVTKYVLKDPLSLQQTRLDQLPFTAAPAVWLEPGTHNRKYLRRSPFAHVDPDEARLFKNLGYAEISYPPVFAASLTNATLVGFRTLLKDDFFLFDEAFVDPAAASRHIRKLSNADEALNELTGLHRIDGCDAFGLNRHSGDTIRIEEPTIMLSSQEPKNYGSFLFRILPKIIVTRYLSKNFKILVSSPYESMSRLLELCGIDSSNVVQQDIRKRYQLDQVIVPSVRNPHGFLDEATLGLFDELRAKVTRGTGTKSNLIFVSRKNFSIAQKPSTSDPENWTPVFRLDQA